MDKAMLLELAKKVENLEGPDRDIDFDIADAVLGKVREPFVRGRCERYTASLDSAMKLVPDGMIAAFTNAGTDSPVEPDFTKSSALVSDWRSTDGMAIIANTPALAVASACLYALANNA